MKSFVPTVLACLLAGGLVSCQTNKDSFAPPPKHVVVSVVSGSAFLKISGTLTRSQTFKTQSLVGDSVQTNESSVDGGTRTVDREITLSASQVFSYDLLPSEVLTISARSVNDGETAQIAVDAAGLRRLYSTQPQGVLGLVFSIGN